jgi:hypothetical protein
MATRSTIAVQLTDGTVHQVYCHWDGYLEGVGSTLESHYNTTAQAKKLVSLGSISSLGPLVKPTGPHTFEEPQQFVTVAYARDRGEELSISKFKDVADYEANGQEEEYDYLFTVNQEWLVRCYATDDKWVNLLDAAVLEEAAREIY